MAKEASRKSLARLGDWIKTPPLSKQARVEVGTLLSLVQDGEAVGMPHSRPMPSVGPRCHELRVTDENRIWRVIYRIDRDEIVVADVFSKTTQKTSKQDIERSKDRLRKFDKVVRSTKRGTKQ
jgi:phage-related protein